VEHLNSGENLGMKIKISDDKEITLTLGSYGLIRNRTTSFRFSQSDEITHIVKQVDKHFHLNSQTENVLFLVIEDWLEPGTDYYDNDTDPGESVMIPHKEQN
jgi:hypothetical protein